MMQFLWDVREEKVWDQVRGRSRERGGGTE